MNTFNTSLRLAPIDLQSMIANLHRSSVGFDQMFDHLNRTTSVAQNNFPPHDIIKQAENVYTIELACAGFKEEELSIAVEDKLLTITGEKQNRQEREYLHQGISAKSFTKVLTLAEHVIVKGANYVDGMLIINVEVEIPDVLKPRKIEISSIKQITK
jgi:molecular chaperone IbpA